MKNKLFFLTILVGLLILPSTSAMQDCWELEDGECTYVNSFTQCHPSYYTAYYDCEADLQNQQNEKSNQTENFLQTFIQLNFPDYEPNSFTETLYDLTNIELITFFIIIFVIIMAIRAGKFSQ